MAADQTSAEWLQQYGKDAPGTGVFLGSSDTGERVFILARDVTHERCIQIAQDYAYVAFKWIPEPVATYAHVQGSRCAVKNEPCKVTCKGLACLCDPDTKTCIDAPSGGGSVEELAPAAASPQAVLA
jgi:hypothetical protein